MDQSEALGRIVLALERIASAIDFDKRGSDGARTPVVRIVDVDRAKVYSTHLGSKLRDDKQPEETK